MQINTTSDALDNLNKKLGGADIEIEPSTNKVDALKKIYKTLGGTDDVSGLSTVYQVLEKITEVAEGGGGGLYKSARVTFDITDGGTPVTDIWNVSFGYLIYFGDYIDEFNEYDMAIRRNHQTTPVVVELPIIENQPCYIALSNFEGTTNNEAPFFYDIEGQSVTVEGGAEIISLENGVINITGDCIIHLPILWD